MSSTLPEWPLTFPRPVIELRHDEEYRAWLYGLITSPMPRAYLMAHPEPPPTGGYVSEYMQRIHSGDRAQFSVRQPKLKWVERAVALFNALAKEPPL